jgi:xylan 1,4-beta-xylosidase
VRGAPDISALAARSPRSATVLMWNYHDDDLPAPPAPITLTIDGCRRARDGDALPHRRTHSNSYSAWLKMGSPQKPTPAQYAALEKASELETLRPARQATVGRDGRLTGHVRPAAQECVVREVTW